MAVDRSAKRVRRDLIRLSHAGLAPQALLGEMVSLIRRIIPLDAAWAATTDPATILFTGSVVDGIPETATPRFVANEFLEDDVNKFARLARGAEPVRSLYAATNGAPARSPRYREFLAPIGLGDELRAALRTGAACWGVLCLHRELAPTGFTADEVDVIRRLAPHVAEGLRAALLLDRADATPGAEAPGLVLLNDDLSPVAMTAAAQTMLDELADWPERRELPQAIVAVAARLKRLERDGDAPPDLVPRGRLRTRTGRWLVLHASRLAGVEPDSRIAVILEAARPLEVAPMLLAAYDLTPREIEVTALVLAGRSTDTIAAALVISAFTVQQHLKSIFEKVGVRSRRELVARVFADQYAPRMQSGTPLGTDGWFITSTSAGD